MRRILLFAEDYGHEKVIVSLVERLSHEANVEISIIPRNVRGGHGKVVSEFRGFLDDLNREKEAWPDLLIVVTDSNCMGYEKRKREIDEKNRFHKDFTIYAIPDPHIERWLLLDSAAFKKVMGRGCRAPDQKCIRDRYKELLRGAMREAGVAPPLGGLEYAHDIVYAMDFGRIANVDCSFKKFYDDITLKFKEWRR